jgi:hypothetical protein
MHRSRFGVLAWQVGAIDRMTSLKVLGGSLAALAAARPLRTEAGKNKPCRKKVRNAVQKTCGKQVAQCEVAFAVLNPGKIDCCQLLRDCDFQGHIQCVV